MKLGLLTDIHERNDWLRIALDHFHRLKVDQVVVVGDVFAMGEQIEETCRLLAEAKAIGVWGNHDYGLCVEPAEQTRRRFSDGVMEYMAGLKSRLIIDDCYFAHVEPWLDPDDITDLWFYEGPPDDESRVDKIFHAVPNRLMFAGHYHRWMLVTPTGIADWGGECPIKLNPGRYFIVVGALLEGHFATFDTETHELEPLRC